MPHVRTIILGAGPSGLSLGQRLLQLGDDSFVVFEKESAPGGLCRSQMVDGAPLDIGGGHFLDVRQPHANRFLFGFLPESSWATYKRKSTIHVHGCEIDYPFEANLWQLPVRLQLDYLESIARAGSQTGQPMPAMFREWIVWKLGERVAADYMLPYNQKIWSLDDLDQLGTYWLHKLPDVSFRETLRSCLERTPAGRLPAHAVFLYPREGGYGHVWRRMGERLGARLLLDRPVQAIDVEARRVDEFTAERIVTTIPWPEFAAVATGLPDSIRAAVGKLKQAAIDIAYRPRNLASPAHWIYVPDAAVYHHRLLLRHNFCPGARGHWSETNVRRLADGQGDQPPPIWRHVNDYAYPLNLRDKPAAIAAILDWSRPRRLLGLGRWGEWEHMNSDVAVAASLRLAEELVNQGQSPAPC